MIHPFDTTEIVGWLERNSLAEAVDSFRNGCREIDMALDRQNQECLDIVLCAATPQSWIGYGFACMVKKQRVWFTSPYWKEREWTQVAKKVVPHLTFGAPIPETTFGNAQRNPGSDSRETGVMIPTGGSSGDIKFAWHTVDTMTQAVIGMGRFFLGRDMQRGDFCYRCDLPQWHISGWMQLMRAYLSDSVWLPDTAFVLPSNQLGLQWLSLVPTQLARMLDSDSLDRLRDADFIVIGGGACPVSLLRRSMREGLAPWVTYGMTETAGMIAGKQIRNESDLEVGAQVFPHCEISIQPLQDMPGGSGEIMLRCRSLCLGYDGKRFPGDAWFPTGDIGSLTEDHCLHMRGRLDSILNTGGEKVYPAEVQEVIGMHPTVSDCRVIGMSDPEWGTRVACVYTTVDGKPLDPRMLKQHVSAKLSAYKIPKLWKHVDAIPYDAKGKIQTSRLTLLLGDGVEKC